MLDQSIARVETTLRHHKFTLSATPPLFLVTWLGFAATAAPRPESFLASLRAIPWFRTALLGGRDRGDWSGWPSSCSSPSAAAGAS